MTIVTVPASEEVVKLDEASAWFPAFVIPETTHRKSAESK